MSLAAVVLLGAMAAAVALLYNSLVRAHLRVKEAWSTVDVQLQRRASLVPNLVEIVKGYAGHERAVLTSVVEARTALGAAGSPHAAANASETLSGALGRLFAVAEAYPDLKANQQFSELHAELTNTENQLAYARNYYNGAVEIYNTRAQTIPGNIVAPVFHFVTAEFFTADQSARQPVRATLN